MLTFARVRPSGMIFVSRIAAERFAQPTAAAVVYYWCTYHTDVCQETIRDVFANFLGIFLMDVRVCCCCCTCRAGQGDGLHYQHLVAQLLTRDDPETLWRLYLGLAQCVTIISQQ